jgi:hypothetical protein
MRLPPGTWLIVLLYAVVMLDGFALTGWWWIRD